MKEFEGTFIMDNGTIYHDKTYAIFKLCAYIKLYFRNSAKMIKIEEVY